LWRGGRAGGSGAGAVRPLADAGRLPLAVVGVRLAVAAADGTDGRVARRRLRDARAARVDGRAGAGRQLAELTARGAHRPRAAATRRAAAPAAAGPGRAAQAGRARAAAGPRHARGAGRAAPAAGARTGRPEGAARAARSESAARPGGARGAREA